MAKSIVCVGFQLAVEGAVTKPFASNTSLLDWDIVLFRPDISGYLNKYQETTYNGKRCLDDTQSFKLKEGCEHWRREIREAFDGGKTIIVFLSDVEEVYVATGQKQYSGTGRSRQETSIVDLYSNYRSLPISEKTVSTHGSSMKLAHPNGSILSTYWTEFEKESSYHVIFPDAKKSCIHTKTGEKPVGMIFYSAKSNGSLLLLPDIDFERDEFFTSRGEKYTKKAQEFAARFLAQIVSLDKAIRSSSEMTPEPNWLSDHRFTTNKEASLRQMLLLAEAAVEEAQKKKESIKDEIQDSGRLKGLLFESGKILEAAIVEALKTIGFSAAPFQNSDSEFDVVFESAEGRLIGEAEGKDNKAINVEKLRQLSMNIHEDLQREDVHVSAKGILFGNGYRQSEPAGRAIQFTDKCISAAQSIGIGLVATSDLYSVVKHLLDSPDDDFARECRQAMVAGTGVVRFPVTPTIHSSSGSKVDID